MYQKQSEEKVSIDQKNQYAANRIIRNAIICFKRSWSSEDFLALNEMNHLNDIDIENYVSATKNDSRANFFRLRNLIYDAFTGKIRSFFEKVDDIAVTLDKVTVQRVSYTVVMTYYFKEGKIHCILNKLQGALHVL